MHVIYNSLCTQVLQLQICPSTPSKIKCPVRDTFFKLSRLQDVNIGELQKLNAIEHNRKFINIQEVTKFLKMLRREFN